MKSSSASLPSQYIEALERALKVVVDRANDKLALIEARADALEAKSASLITYAETRVTERLAAVRDGKDIDPEAVKAMVAEAVAEAVAAIPIPKDGQAGAPGKDADPELIARMVGEAVAKIPPAKDGEPGKDGADGKLPLVKEWGEGVHYAGAVVSHRGGTYQATTDTGREPPHADWRCLASPGRDGEDGRSFNIRGTWTEGEAYSALDVVALGGASFAARKDNPGPCPGDGWQLIAAQGKRGAPGERGGIGPQGKRGDPGAPVIAIDQDKYGVLTVTNGDGSTVSCDLHPDAVR